MSHCVGTHNGQERIAACRQVWQGPAQNIEHCFSFLVCHHPSNTPISLFHIAGPNYYVRANLSQLNVNVLTLAVRQTGSHIQVFNFQAGTLHSVIDSHGARLRRPTGQTETKKTFTSWFPHTQYFCFLKRVTNDLSPSAKFWMEIKRPEILWIVKTVMIFSGICVSPLGDRYAYIVDIGADCVRKFRYK